ncbi:fructosamine kinase family protein [uncultured Draconibacterium sp.]|uniref:fructosamine kinase family protein n=1 Tax=uncultured Draconibacterium sp. TaxID=1573823 RepID=UPI003261610D
MRYFSEEIVLKQIEKHLSEIYNENVRINAVSTVGGGCINHAKKLDTSMGTYFIKWNSDCEKDMFIREAESLSALHKAASGSLLVPGVICATEPGEVPAYLVLEYLSPNGVANDEALGRGLAHIHKYSNEQFGFYSDNYCGATRQSNSWKLDWIEFYRVNRLGFLLHLIQQNRPMGNKELAVFEKLLERLDVLIPNKEKAVLVHGDLWSGNYMNTAAGPALIDPASSFSHREMEFGIITMFGGFSERFYAAYNEVNPLDKAWRERNLLYQLYHVLNHFFLFGGGYLSQALAIAKRYL